VFCELGQCALGLGGWKSASSWASGGAYGKLGVWRSGRQIKACGKLGVWGVEKSYYLGDWRKALDKTYYKLRVCEGVGATSRRTFMGRRQDVLSWGDVKTYFHGAT